MSPNSFEDNEERQATILFTIMTLLSALSTTLVFTIQHGSRIGILAGVQTLLVYPIIGLGYGRILSLLWVWAFDSPLSKIRRTNFGAFWFINGLPVTLYCILHGLIKRMI